MDEITEIKALNEELPTPQNGNILGGTYAYLTQKNPTLERKNQDSVGIYANDHQAILIVADGIGGHRMGDEASKIAVSSIIDACKKRNIIDIDDIYQSIIEANQKVRGLNVGAGTTICIGFVNNDSLTFFNSGDSKGIHISGKGKVKTETVDHSSAGLASHSELFSTKAIEEQDGGNQLIHALGDEVLHVAVSGPIEITTRDSILLCSDGLTANLKHDEIAQIITIGSINDRVVGLQEMAQKKMNGDNGHPDDLSIVLFSLGRSDSTETTEEEEKKA
jgi:serine/threonine protein phosphatase PrpC